MSEEISTITTEMTFKTEVYFLYLIRITNDEYFAFFIWAVTTKCVTIKGVYYFIFNDVVLLRKCEIYFRRFHLKA